MSVESEEYGFMAVDQGDGEITLCDSFGGGVTLSNGPFLTEDIASYIRSQAQVIAEEIVSDLDAEQ